MPRRAVNLLLLLSLLAIFGWSLYHPKDLFTWFLEVAPALAGAAVLALVYRRSRPTQLLLVLLWLHAIVLIVGGKYTYAENPLFEWLKGALHLQRNYYDRLGHFFQGFVPAILAREVLLRSSPLRPGRWLFFIVVCICLAASAFYELIEWWVALATGEKADAFLGTQGDVWDTQWDMAMALSGAILAQLALARAHDRALGRLAEEPGVSAARP